MKDLRSEIPALAYISAQIVQEAERTGALATPTRSVENSYHLPAGSLSVMNPSHILGLLYCLIVVPKEHWIRDKNHPVFEKITPEMMLQMVDVSLKSSAFEANPGHELLRHLRNAVAHARFAIGDDSFTFWDQDKKHQEIFRATFTLDNLGRFLSTVGASLANLRTSQPHLH